jgi:hypothetical protein
MTTDSFLYWCKKYGITIDDLEFMTVGMCFDYMFCCIEMQNPNNKPKVRTATQADFDAF